MRRGRLTYANVISTLCLFLLLGGGAWAATSLPKNSVGTKQLKPSAVTGEKVKDGSLTGADIQASTLGTVPKASSAATATEAGHATSADSAGHADSATNAGHATSADSAATAGDATTLDGASASSFLPAGRVTRISYEGHWESEPPAARPVFTFGPLTVSALCLESQLGPPSRTLMEIEATGAAGSTVDFSSQAGTATKVGVVSLEPAAPAVIGEAFHSSETEAVHGFMTLVYRDSARTISVSLGLLADEGDTCRITGTGVVAE